MDSSPPAPPAGLLAAFDWQGVQQVRFGPGCLAELGQVARQLFGQRAFLVSDPGIAATGMVTRAESLLQQAGVEVLTFTEVAENPTTDHVDQAARLARDFRADLLIGLGGGSAMDVAKGANFLLAGGGSMADYWGTGKGRGRFLPSIGIPTTAGTGSEAQSYALISDPKSHQKMACGDKRAMFAAVLLDPELTLTQPPRVTALTGLDALAHAIESFVTRKRNSLSSLFSREAYRLISVALPRVLETPENLEARGAMLLGAHYAGVAIENSMLGAAHSLANPLTAHCNVTHGLAVALCLPAVIAFNSAVAEELYQELEPTEAEDSKPASQRIAARVYRLLELAGLPMSLVDAGVQRDLFPQWAQEAAAQWTLAFNPRPASATELERLYLAAYNGTITDIA